MNWIQDHNMGRFDFYLRVQQRALVMDKDLYHISKVAGQSDLSSRALEPHALGLLIIAGATAVMFLIGRDVLGEGVIALLYVALISLVAARWGQGPGIVAAIAAALAFDFLFIPPFFTFNVGSVEGWLLLVIFLIVAIVVVGRIQVGFNQAQQREHEAVMMYELSADLAAARTPAAISQALAAKVQQVYQLKLVQVVIESDNHPVVANVPDVEPPVKKPDLILPIMAARDLIGEVRMWQGEYSLPATDNRLLLNFTNQSALALERAHLEAERR
jgi:K+-sensing histidine kinase KdpD